jgi:microcystin-dependent protein
MTYTKNNNPWTTASVITTTVMDNFETIYTEASSYVTSHIHDSLYQTKTEMEAVYWYAGNDGSGSGSDADLLYKVGGNLHAAGFSGLGVPTGLIILWYGSIVNIPAGWHLCDGTSGTIDLVDRFVMGSGTGAVYNPGETGGGTTFTAGGVITVADHQLTTAEIPAHNHPFTDTCPNTFSGASYQGGSSFNADSTTTSGNTSSEGGNGAHTHSSGDGTHMDVDAVGVMPYFYALAYIQKI